MKPETKVSLSILGYCIFLWLTNWSIGNHYDRTNGTTFTGVDLRGFGLLVSAVATYMITKRIWKTIRLYLDQGIRIPSTTRLLGDWTYLILLIPLFVTYSSTSYSTATDGAGVETKFVYGEGISWVTFIFSSISIMLFQVLSKLKQST
jgi:hypothetical protein